MKRKHQKQFESIVDNIIAGPLPIQVKTMLLSVVPGGGKSAIPIIAGKLIKAGLANCICWISPRQALQSQGERNFQDPFFRELFCHDLSIRASTNEFDPCRNLNGFITTYQAAGVDSNQTLLYEFQRKNVILILDEFHHVEEGGAWHEALKPLVELSAFLVLMSGTLERGDKKRIAFLDYVETDQGFVPDIRETESFKVVEYSRKDALSEQAIIPFDFSLHDGNVSYQDEAGTVIEIDKISRVSRKDNSAAIYTALETEYAIELLKMAVKHWQQHRLKDASSKLLVVTANKKHADKAIDLLKQAGFNAEIATSHESTAAHKKIDRFKAGSIDILVTIAMAYEGLDVPEITHIVCLTHIRSIPWIIQMLARANRVNKLIPYAQQTGFIFAPDDPVFRKIVEHMRAEQLSHIPRSSMTQLELFEKEGGEYEKKCGDCDKFETSKCFEKTYYGNTDTCMFFHSDHNPLGIKPLESSLTGHRNLSLDSGNNFSDVIPIQKTPKQLEIEKRKQIERHVRLFSFNNRYQDGTINKELKDKYGKSRALMTLRELEDVFDYIQHKYPINRIIRGSGRRVPTKAKAWTGSIPVYK